MTMKKNNLINTKKSKIKISSIKDLQNQLIKDEYITSPLENTLLMNKIKIIFNIDNSVINYLVEILDNENITYRANNIFEFFNYIKNIIIYEKYYKVLCKNIMEINKLKICRVEYDRVQTTQDDVDDILKEVNMLKERISSKMDMENSLKITTLEEEISSDYIYTKDIELLKKIIFNDNIKEEYNEETNIKTLFIDIPNQLNAGYIKSHKGSIEYYHHISKNIPRMKRLIKNMHNYLNVVDKEKSYFEINQSNTLQDSINLAFASFNNKEFKAISGSNEIKGYCKSPEYNKQAFISNKVNKLGKLGIGYNRINDSEKKIFEEIHKQITLNNLIDSGDLILYSKWQPCLSCYSVISQFCKLYPNINVKVEYIKKYGEH